MKTLLLAAVAGASTFTAGAAMAATAVMYQTDFNSSSAYAGVTVLGAGAGALGDVGASTYGDVTGQFFYNDATGNPAVGTSLALANLPSHDSITVDLDAIFIDSWDSTNGSPAPDFFDIYLDGALAVRMTSNNASGNVNDFAGGTSTHFGGFFYNGNWAERVVDMSTASALTISHSASTFVLSINASGGGWQGGSDESWGMDNLVISANLVAPPPTPGVPEPATWAMMIGGFAGMGALLRRRRTASAAA